jgi:MFS family permease
VGIFVAATLDDIKAVLLEIQKKEGGGTININAAGQPVDAAGYKTMIEQAEALTDQYKQLGDTTEHRILQQQQEIETAKLRLAQAQKEWEQTDKHDKEAANRALEKIQKAHEHLGVQKEQLETIKGTSKAIKEGVQAADALGKSLGSSLGQYGKHPFFNTDTFTSLYKTLKGGPKAWGAFFGSLGISLLTNFVNSFISLIFELDKAESALKRATGANEALANSMTNAYAETRLYGVSIQEMSGQYQELYSTFTDFTFANEEQQRELAKTGALLQELGVGANDYAKSIQLSTKAFAMSSEEAAASSRELASLAMNIGVPPGEMAKQFANMGGGLAKLGEDGVKAFKDLAIVSKTTGMEMQKILAITDKFDTFEGAATQAGKLNAALGGNFVNAMDLMMATDPAERFGMIRDSILDTGLTFDDMSYYQRKFYTDALGLNDVSDLALMLSGDMSTLEGATTKTTAQYEDLAKRTKAVQSITEKFQTLMASMIPIVTPLIDELQKMADEYLNNEEKMANLQEIGSALISILKGIGNVVAFVIEHWKVFAAIGGAILLVKMGGWVKKLFKFKEAAEETGDSFSKKLGDSIKNVGEAAKGKEKAFLALGGAIALVGAGVALAALGVAELVRSFGDAGDNAGMAVVGILAFGAVMIGLVAVFMTLAPAAAVAAGPMLALGAAMLMLGAGVGLAAAGMAMLVGAFGELFASIDPEKMSSTLVFFGGIATLAPGLALAAMAIAGMTVALAGFKVSLALFDEDDTAPLTNLLQSIAQANTEQLDAVAKSIDGIVEQIESIPTEKAVALTTTLATAAIAGPAMMAAVSGYKAVTEVIHTLVGGGDEEADHTPINMNVTLTIDGDKLDNRVLKVVGGKVAEGIIR